MVDAEFDIRTEGQKVESKGMNAGKDFGVLLRRRRREMGFTLRAFARMVEIDPGNLSRWERSIWAPPREGPVLARMARALGIVNGTIEHRYFMDIAAISAGELPMDIAGNDAILKKIPDLLKKAREKE